MSESNYLTSALSRKPRPASKEVREARIFELDVSEIQADPTQPRKHFDKTKLESLALSIIKNEQLTPIQVISLDGGGH